MRVLQLISTAGYYGAESMVLNLVHPASRAADQLLAVFYNHHHPNRDLYDRAIQTGVPAVLIECEGRADRKALRKIQHVMRDHSIDLVHTHNYKSDLYGYFAARNEKKPIVATCHNWISGGMLDAYNFLDRVVLKRFNAISAVSEKVAGRLVGAGISIDRVRVIPNGIDTYAFTSGRAAFSVGQRKTLGIVARLDLQKGFEYLISAAAALRPSVPELRLLIVGEGPDRGKIENLIRQHGLTDAAEMPGERTDMAGVYASMDIFVLPSLNEGMPMTVLEAMAASRPVVATRVGGIPRIVQDAENGILVEPADQESLTTSLRQLLENPDLSRSLGENARKHVQQNYTAAAMREAYDELYRKVLSGRSITQQPENVDMAQR